MPICGFNKKMLEGLASFYEGLVEHGIIERAKQKNISHEEILQREFKDMDGLLKETNLIVDPIKRGLIENLVRHTQVFYQLVEQKGVENVGEIVSGLTKLYEGMDRKYYSELEGQPDSMKKLVGYLNEIAE